jgi:hypothetical protein
VIQASHNFVRVIIRRPHAYRFRDRYTGKGSDAGIPIPSILLLNTQEQILWSGTVEQFRGNIGELVRQYGPEPTG